jgi:peptidoglycan/LPS O-acetylase OafA/YrhL
MSPRPERLAALTSLRFIAALHVVLFHVWILELPEFQAAPAWLERVLEAGPTSVSLFYVLSGFILTYNYVTPSGDTSVRARDFWIARLARIYPVYLLAFVLYAPIMVLDTEPALWLRVLSGLAALLALQSWFAPTAFVWNPPGWSISVEALFYGLFPFLASSRLVRLSTRALVAGVVALWALSMACAAAYALLDPDGLGQPHHLSRAFWFDWIRTFPLLRLPEFLLGMAFGVLFLRDGERPRHGRAFALIAAGVIAAVYWASPGIHFVILNNAALMPAFGLLVYGLAHRAPRALEHPALVRLGEASYALYILHAPVGFLLLFGLWALGVPIGLWACAAFVIFTVCVALTVHRRCEIPLRRRIRHALSAPRLQGRLNGRRRRLACSENGAAGGETS